MGDLIHIRGIQAIFAFVPKIRDGRLSPLVLKVGPFFKDEDFVAWRVNFLDILRQEAEKYGSAYDCADPIKEFAEYEPRDLAIFFPRPPDVMSSAVIDCMHKVEAEAEVAARRQEADDRSFYWNATIRFKFLSPRSRSETEVSFGPFNSRDELSAWWSKFLRGVRQRVAQLRGVKFTVLKTETSECGDQFCRGDGAGEEEEAEYLLVDCQSPRMEGKNFCSEHLQDWFLIEKGRV